MARCVHKNLEVLLETKQKHRCIHCRLVISAEELSDGYCPECYEVRGVRHYDFEDIEEKDGNKVRFRCEDCGAIIKW